MVLNSQRKRIDPLLSLFAKPLLKINPDVLTWISVLFALIAGFLFYRSTPVNEDFSYFLLIASIFVFLNGFFDALDGKIAKITKKDSLRGDFLDHALDRYADVLILGGLAISAWCRYPTIGLFAVVGMLLTSYMGTQAQAVGCKRNYSGLLGRADRLVLLIFIPIIQHFYLDFDIYFFINLNIIEMMLLWFGIVGNLTALQRFISTLIWFRKKT